MTHEIAARAGEIDGRLAEAGRAIGVTDSVIAATALDHHEPVVTRNAKHFARIEGLEIVRY